MYHSIFYDYLLHDISNASIQLQRRNSLKRSASIRHDIAGKASVLSKLSEMTLQFIFLWLASILAASNAVIVDCSYSTNGNYYQWVVYSCTATVSTLDNNEAITAVTDSTGSADPTLQVSDVKWFTLSNGHGLNVYHIPSNFATIFPNLVGFSWLGSKLRTISPSDLLPYPNLIFFAVGMNMIRKVDGNLFQNNKQLQYLDLGMNAIDEIGTGLLNGLNDLTNIMLYNNICTGTGNPLYLNPPSNTIADISRDLDFICGPSTESSESSGTTGPCDPCFANCTARAAALQIRVDAITESIYAPWFYKIKAFFKALSMW